MQGDDSQTALKKALRRHSDDTHSDSSQTAALRRQQSDGSSQTAVRGQADAQRALGWHSRRSQSPPPPCPFASGASSIVSSTRAARSARCPCRCVRAQPRGTRPAHTHTHTHREREREREKASLVPAAIRGIQMPSKASRDHQRQSEVLTCRESTSLLPGVMSSASRRHCSATSCWPSACAALALLTKALMEHGSYSIARLASARHCSKRRI
jgi:hypothetical protein